MDLRAHIESTGTIADIAAYLGNLPSNQRAAAVLSLRKSHQRALYLKAAASPDVQATDFVPEDLEANTGLRHHGHNSMPVFTEFEKHFAQSGEQIIGFNESSTRRFIGPGYFICRPTVGEECLRSSWVVDYFQVPRGEIPSTWPDVKPNWRGLQILVYHHMRDYMRRVCDGVLIGSAYRTVLGREFDLHSYFVLVQGVP